MKFDYVIVVTYSDADVTFCHALGSALERKGASVAFLVHTKYGTEALKRNHEHVFYVYDGFDPHGPLDVARANELEKKYKFDSIAGLVFPEQVTPGARDTENLVRRAVHCFGVLERLHAEHDISFFISNLGPEVIRRCLFRFRDAGGPNIIVLDFVPIHDRIVLTTHEVLWDEFPKELPTLTPEQRQRVVDYIEQVTAHGKPFAVPTALPLRWRNVVNAARYTVRAFQENLDQSVPELYYQRAEALLRVRLAKLLYEAPVEGEPFFFFPLHLSDDSAITFRAPQFQRQEDIVRYIAERALPLGTKLYVKPHPAALHAYPLSTLRTLANIPNVRLIDPHVPAKELVRRAEAVTVINSTVGFESLLFGKPTICLGPVFYRGWGLTTDVDQLAYLPRAIAEAREKPMDRERLYAFVHACFASSYPGDLYAETPENIEILSDAFLRKADQLGKPARHGTRQPASASA